MEELSLKWDEHHPAVISVFEELLAKGTLVDCTIAADGQYMKAHKVVLAACSPYFEHSGSCDDNAMCVEDPYHPEINFETTSLSEKCNVFFTEADLKRFNYYKPDVVEMNLRLSLADVTAIMNDTSVIPVKECVIFYMLFSQESEKNPIVVLKDMKFQELKHLIDFVYRGQVKLPKDQLDAFVSAAESLQIKGLSGQQKKKISERFANKTVSSREVCSSPVPRKRRRNSHTETNEDSQSEPGNESSSDSNMRENFMPTPMPLGMPCTSTASSSTGISSHSVSSQQSRSLTDTRFPSHDQSSASSEQVLPDVQTVVKTEPEDPTEPLAQVFVPEPKNEEYVDDMAMLESGAGSSDMQGGTSQENTNNYPDDILEKESSSSVDLLPEKTKLRYEKEYQDFQHWRQCKDIDFVNETVMLAYAEEKSDTYSPTSLWTKFSMLKLALKVHESIDISSNDKFYLRTLEEYYMDQSYQLSNIIVLNSSTIKVKIALKSEPNFTVSADREIEMDEKNCE
ncbi:uncharacterized protein GBIM_01781 [Gryllus bimaculatus]|nr:uncharacterized protein GBIM_01781 [Gryllus bimaculatus]